MAIMRTLGNYRDVSLSVSVRPITVYFERKILALCKLDPYECIQESNESIRERE